MWELTFPRTVVIGEDALSYLKTIEGKRALIVTDKVIHKLDFMTKVSDYLKEAGLAARVFDDVEPEPSVETIEKGAEFAKGYGPDWFIAVGGGSCMDAAKAMWVLYENPSVAVGAISPLSKLGLRKKARLICIPTTSGTGSDATWVTVITNVDEKRKMDLASREIVSDISILDPELPKGMSSKLAAGTGLDALAHGIEGYVSQWRNDFSDALAIGAIQMVFKYLPRAHKNPEDKEAKEKMHNAATMAGMSFGNSNAGIAHSLGHSLGAIFHIPHGRSVSLFLPISIEYDAEQAHERYANIAREIGIKAESDEEALGKLVEAVRKLIHEVGEPTTLKEAGITKKDLEARLDDLAERVGSSNTSFANPRVPNTEETKKLFMYAYDGKKIDF
jgi:alcohol dehydrogenase class IV